MPLPSRSPNTYVWTSWPISARVCRDTVLNELNSMFHRNSSLSNGSSINHCSHWGNAVVWAQLPGYNSQRGERLYTGKLYKTKLVKFCLHTAFFFQHISLTLLSALPSYTLLFCLAVCSSRYESRIWLRSSINSTWELCLKIIKVFFFF